MALGDTTVVTPVIDVPGIGAAGKTVTVYETVQVQNFIASGAIVRGTTLPPVFGIPYTGSVGQKITITLTKDVPGVGAAGNTYTVVNTPYITYLLGGSSASGNPGPPAATLTLTVLASDIYSLVDTGSSLVLLGGDTYALTDNAVTLLGGDSYLLTA